MLHILTILKTMTTNESPAKRTSPRIVKQIPLSGQFTTINHLFHSPVTTKMLPSSKLKVIHTNPNIFFVNDFLSEKDINWLDLLCTEYAKQFRSSFTEGEDKERVLSEERTSKFIHLAKAQDNTCRLIETRAAGLLGLSSDMVEPLQIVSYTSGQKFTAHHDAGTMMDDGTIEMITPRRLVTLFLYLNDLPEGEGHTEFPSIGVSVQPKRGCGVMFCNILPDGTADDRTIHQANPVSGGLRKYGLNVWITDSSQQQFALESNGKLISRKRAKEMAEEVADAGTSALAVAQRSLEQYELNKAQKQERSAKRQKSLPFPEETLDDVNLDRDGMMTRRSMRARRLSSARDLEESDAADTAVVSTTGSIEMETTFDGEDAAGVPEIERGRETEVEGKGEVESSGNDRQEKEKATNPVGEGEGEGEVDGGGGEEERRGGCDVDIREGEKEVIEGTETKTAAGQQGIDGDLIGEVKVNESREVFEVERDEAVAR